MKIHEYQAKELLRRYGVSVPEGAVAETAEEARRIAQGFGGGSVVIKAQIHAGGRGKAGGVKVAKTLNEAKDYANEILGKTLITPQTGPEGKKVHKVLVEKGLDIKNEYYLGIALDRSVGKPVFMASTEGGMDIEEVAAKHPEKIFKKTIDPLIGFQPFMARKIAFTLGFRGEAFKQAVGIITGVYNAYIQCDASIVEVNPLVLTEDEKLLALDAKMTIDDNALFRHPDIAEMRDIAEEHPLEVEAEKYNLSYVQLEGNIGCMVNGAGLAMATMDMIKKAGGSPANFLDIGGTANTKTVTKGLEIILKYKDVKAIWINIFGGIVRCDRVAAGIIQAAKEVDIKVPLVVRLEGTNAEEGHELLKQSDVEIILADRMKDGAEKVLAAVQGKKK